MPRKGEGRTQRRSRRSNGDRRHRNHQQSDMMDRDSRDTDYASNHVNPYLESPSMTRAQSARLEHYIEGSITSDGFRQSDAYTLDNTSDTSFSTIYEELQRLCDVAANPESWNAVRNWFRLHSATDARHAAERRGDYDTVPLHLACRSNPPADVIQMLLMASPEMVRAADSFGWLPLHYACANDASEEVLTLLVTEYPESVTSVDKRKRTPLHFALGKAERPADKGVVLLLSETGAALFPDENGMLPLHYACAYGATEEALRVLTDDNIMTITATDVRGRTPLHFALGNADRPASPAVVRLLISQNPAVVDSIDKVGDLAIHLLATRSHAIREFETEKRLNCQKCLGYYLEANPRPTAGLLMALQSLPDWLRDIAVVHPVVQRFLNIKISKSFPTAVTFCDFVFYILVIAFFQMAVIDSIRDRSNAIENADATKSLNRGYLVVLYVAAIYFAFRELVQAVSLATLGLLSTWLSDTTNWYDIVYIILILFWSVCMEKQTMSLHSFQIGAALTVMVFWVNVLLFLKGIMVGFAVFVGGVVYVVKRLAAFFLALLIILLAFAQIFYTIFRMTGDPNDPESGCSSTNSTDYISIPWALDEEVCDNADPLDCVNPEPDSCEPNNSYPWCSFWTSFYKTYSMLLGEVDDNDFAGSILATFFFCLYMFGVVIVLANVLIAIVTESYSVIKNERAAVVFWSNRLDFIAEMDVIGSHVYNRCKRFINPDDNDWEERTSVLGEIWKMFMYFFDENEQRLRGDISLEFLFFNLIRLGIACIVIPLWIILGAITFGLLWPPQVREYLLTSQLTRASKKGEEDAARLERVEELRQDVATFHQEVLGDIDKGREELSNIRVFLSGAKLEIATEMKDVKRIVMELYENTLD